MINHTRSKLVVEARHIAFYLMLQTTDCRLGDAGEILGGRTPATVLNSYRRICDRLYCQDDKELGIKIMGIQGNILERDGSIDNDR